MPSHTTGRHMPAREHRPEIEGLRAVAALLVAIYHVFVGRVSGAVDVFFVVAGFLVTMSLLHQVHARGRVSISRYLSRLARRLLPTALVVLVVVLASAPLWLPVTRLRATFTEVAASALYLENWALAAKAVDYLARDDEPSPVQHFWAMSVQGQFYLLWLVLILLVLAWGAASARRNLAVAMVGLLAGSFTFSVLLTQANQPLAYFHTATRVWEFAAGGLVALAPAAFARLPAPVRAVGTWIGLLMIVSTALVWPVSTAFPGWVASWPVVAAVLILLCTHPGSSRSRWSAEWLLGSRPLTWLGGYSYGLYLWHWPLLSIVLTRSGSAEVDLVTGAGIIAAALVLSVLTTRLVEAPIRSHQIRMPRRAMALGAAAVLIVATVAGVLSWQARQQPRPMAIATAGTHPGAAVLLPEAASDAESPPVAPQPPVGTATEDKAAVYADGCHQDQEASEPLACVYGNPDGAMTVYLIGSSHAAHWFPAMEHVATDNGWRLVSITKSSCVFSADPAGPTGATGTVLGACERWNRNVMELIARETPDLVVTTGTHGSDQSRTIPDGYLTHWEELSGLGVPVVAIRDTPWWPSSRPDCLALHGADSGRCDGLREDLLASVDPTAQVTLPPGVTFVDLNDYLCPDRWCPAVIGNVLVYYDAHHLTATYSRSLAPMLAQALADVGYGPSDTAQPDAPDRTPERTGAGGRT